MLTVPEKSWHEIQSEVEAKEENDKGRKREEKLSHKIRKESRENHGKAFLEATEEYKMLGSDVAGAVNGIGKVDGGCAKSKDVPSLAERILQKVQKFKNEKNATFADNARETDKPVTIKTSAASPSRKVRPGPLSKKRKVEEKMSEEKPTSDNWSPENVTTVGKKGKCHSVTSSSGDTEAARVPQIKNFFTPSCPKSKKPKLERTDQSEKKEPEKRRIIEIKLSSTENDGATISGQLDFRKALSSVSTISCASAEIAQKPVKKCRPCPLSKKSAVSNTSEKINEDISEVTKDFPSRSIVAIEVRDTQVGDSTSDCIPAAIEDESEVKREKPRPVQATVTTTTTPQLMLQHKVVEVKWKETLANLQQEVGLPENVNVLTNFFSTKILLNLQQTLNENKPLHLFELVIPHIWMDLSFRDLLRCRLVCGRWMRAVDDLLQNQPYLEAEMESEHDAHDFRTNRAKSVFDRRLLSHRQSSIFQFISNEKVKVFQMKTKDHLRNPFVTRSLMVRVSLEPNEFDLSVHWINVRELFRIHGVHVWHLHLDIQGHHSVENAYKLVRRLLKHVPNLRSLELSCHPIDTSFCDISPESDLDSLPNLIYLKSLDLKGAKFPSSVISIFIETYAESLENLKVSLYRWNEDNAELISNLNQLHITAMCSHENLPHLYSQLENLQGLTVLTKLSLTVMVRLEASTLFGILQDFDSLRIIKIVLLEHMGDEPHLQDDISISSSINSPPNLYQVYSLQLSLTPAQRSLRFLKWFPSLVSVHFAVDRDFITALRNESSSTKAKQEKILRHVKRCIVNESAVKSSIWSLLPSLNVLTIVQPADFYGNLVDLCFLRDFCE